MIRTLIYFLREIPKRSLPFLFRRLMDRVLLSMRHLAALHFGLRPYRSRLGEPALGRSCKVLDLEAIDHLLAHLAGGAEIERLWRRAESVCRLEFEIFGQTHSLGYPLPWHRDPVSGMDWPVRFHLGYYYSELTDQDRPSDIKIPWELGRLQELSVLALSYRTTRDDRFIDTMGMLLDDWDQANPVGYGIQWTVGMEAALRAISLILAAELLVGTEAEKRLVNRRYLQRLEEHARFLFRNVEYSDINSNHNTACLLGLLYLGVWLPEATEAFEWRRYAERHLQRQILAQSYPDGVCHEGSIPYHRLVSEIFLHAWIVASRNKLDLGNEFLTRLIRMLEFTQSYTKPNGLAPVWGDADDGRVHRVGSQDVNDHRYLTLLGGCLFQRIDLIAPGRQLGLDDGLLLDSASLNMAISRQNRETSCTTQPLSSRGFPEGGFFISCGPSHWFLVDCGDVGLRGRGGHGHSDWLSFELALDGMDVLTDTGCSAYTHSKNERRFSLSASSHNSVLVDGLEPAPLRQDRWPTVSAIPYEVLCWSEDEGVFEGRRFGHPDVADCDYFQRRLAPLPDRAGIAILDRIEGRGEHEVIWSFHLAPQWTQIALQDNSALLKHQDSAMQVRILSMTPGLCFESSEKTFYPSYGLARPRQCLSAKLRTFLPIEVRFQILSLPNGET